VQKKVKEERDRDRIILENEKNIFWIKFKS
jgi:hypothetical protein